GQTVYGLDIAPLENARNLDAVRDNPKFHYMQGDIRELDTIKAFFRPEASVLYHLASVVGVRRYMEDPLSLIDIAIIGTRHLIALCVEHDVRILFTSTSEVYGRNPAVPWSE
ncbi:epimerase, partial [Amaricoccus sp. HAR-UPW-R2A-40]